MINPFDDVDGVFLVLVNNVGQHSLWPEFAAAPAGWRIALGPSTKRECLDYTETNWPEVKPGNFVGSRDG